MESDAEIRCRKQPTLSKFPSTRSNTRLTRYALDVLHGGGGLDAGSAVAAKAGADAPGGGISLCFCRRGCAAPAQKDATLNDYRRSNRQKKDATKPTETATKPSGPLFIYNKGWPDGHPLLML